MRISGHSITIPGRQTATLLLLVFTFAAQGAGLPDSVAKRARQLGIDETALGVFVQAVDADAPLVEINPDIPRNPASAIKVITTLAALEELGPAYTWPTEIFTGNRVRNGVLDGDLVIKGFGDPYLVTEEMWKLVQGLRRQGLQTINGDLVVDDSYFVVPDGDPGEFDRRPWHAYNAKPNALLVNLQAVYFHFYTGPDSKSVIIRTEPELPNLQIDNRLVPVTGRCGGYQRGIAMTVPDPLRADRVVFEGRFPTSCWHYVLARSVMTPPTFAFGVFKSLWEQSGGSISGSVRSGLAPKSARPYLVWSSRPLGEIIRTVNKYSNNVMTRQILLTLGAELTGEPGTVEGGFEAIRQYLRKHGIDDSSLVVENGSGLSRNERVSPRLMAELMRHGAGIPYMPEFMASLAILGVDGTARSRLKKRRETGHAHIKTGTIDHVSAVAGFVHAESGRRFVVVGMLNQKNAHHGIGTEVWNSLIQWVFQQ